MDERGIDQHPDLMDPDWQRHAEKEAWTELRKNRRRAKRGRPAKRGRWALWSAVVLVLVAAAAFGVYRWGKSTADHTVSPPPSTLPEIARMDLSQPFLNTPAQAWAAGIAGLATPEPTNVGVFSAQEVGAAIDKVKQVITTANLDRKTLEGHDTAGYLALLAPDARDQVRPIVDGPDKLQASGFITLIADGFHLLPVQPRMSGSLAVRPGTAGELIVHTNYVIAYAFDPGDHEIFGPGDIVPFLRFDGDYVLRSGPTFSRSSAGLWADGSGHYSYSIACTQSNAGFLAPAFSERHIGGPDLSEEPGVFDPNRPMPTQDTCG